MQSWISVLEYVVLWCFLILFLGIACFVGCSRPHSVNQSLSIDPAEVDLGEIELEKKCQFYVAIRSNKNDFTIEKTHASCGCLQVLVEKKKILKNEGCTLSCSLSAGSEAGPFQHFARVVLTNLVDGQPEIVDVPIRYYVKPFPKVTLFNDSAYRFLNKNLFRYKIGFSCKRRADSPQIELSHMMKNSKLFGFQVVDANVVRIPTLNGMVDDCWEFDLEIRDDVDLPEQLLLSCDGVNILRVPMEYELRHPIESSVRSLFLGILQISQEKLFTLSLKNVSFDKVIMKEVVTDGESKLQVKGVPSLVIESGNQMMIEGIVNSSGVVGRKTGEIRVEFETPDLSEIRIPVSWIVK